MTTMDLPRRDIIHQSIGKCSSCEVDINLSRAAEHVCVQYAPVAHHQSYDEHPQRSGGYLQYESSSDPSSFNAHRPVLPKLDSSVNGRSGLRPSEAASIAHDLGLPSPPSAGGSRSPHHSRSKPRKPLIVRPPSPNGPIGQDCAFPPFPTKPKRTQSGKDVKVHKAQSTSRSTTSSRNGQHSSSLSNASSVYSTTSGPTKRRTSNTSSGHRSRQGTIDDSIAIQPTTPSSPHYPAYSPTGREHGADQNHNLPPLVLSDSCTSSAPSSSISSMPSTPSWPTETRELPPKIVPTSNSDAGWTPTERSIPEEYSLEVEAHDYSKQRRNQLETFDKILSPEPLKVDGPMFDNPPKEPLYKAKRPAPLLPTQQYSGGGSMMPLSARVPPPPPPTSSLSRTLNNLFGRKRSKSTAAVNMPSPSFDSPRMRALAPDPPERPKRGESLWDETTPADDIEKDQSISPSIDDKSTGQEISDTVNIQRELHTEHKAPRETGDFNFDFAAEQFARRSPEAIAKRDSPSSDLEQKPVLMLTQVPTIANSDFEQVERDLQRASVDSASSYGSIGFLTHRTGSSRTSPPTSSAGIVENIATMLEPEQPHTSTLELTMPQRVPDDKLVPESPTDPLYHAGKLSPVQELGPLQWSKTLETTHLPEKSLPSALPRAGSTSPTMALQSEQSHHKVLNSPPPRSDSTRSPMRRSNTRGSCNSTRPETPAAIKGTCRGCSNSIMTGQKSVASADGRLTGRYHKECFVCQTCKEPFATVDFYVYDDHPYCAHDYHTLNNSLCVGCGQGIEGQYFETFDVAGSASKKFHPKCLQCTTCKTQLDEDYFEFHGRVYCERDAFRAAGGPRNPYDTVPSRPSPLVREYINSEEPGLKGRFPERRTTRLIMN